MKISKLLFLIASFLWLLWGVFHVMGGFSLMTALSSGDNSIPEIVQMEMMGDETPFYLIQTLKEHAFNNIWFGLVVTIGAIFGFRQKNNAIYLCTIVGGLAHLGFTFFLVLPGKAPLMGVVFSFLVAIAVILGLVGINLRKNKK